MAELEKHEITLIDRIYSGDYTIQNRMTMQVEKKTVDLLYEGDGYYIISPGNRPDSLRAGNEVVVSGRNVHDGMVLE